MNKTYISINCNGMTSKYCLDDFGKDVISFGRSSECDIKIDNAKVSRLHGCFHLENGNWEVQDLNSRNGLLINNLKNTNANLSNGMNIILTGDSTSDLVKITVTMNSSISGGDNIGGISNTPPANKYAVPPSQKKSDKNNTAIIIAGIAAAIVIVILGVGITLMSRGKKLNDKVASLDDGSGDNKSNTEIFKNPFSLNPDTNEGKELSPEEIFEEVRISTVEVQAEKTNTMGSIGTGFFCDENGTVITNYHVIDGTYQAIIKTSDNQTYNVTGVVGYDRIKDIAILSTDATNSIPLPRGNEEIKTGAKVYALGSSLGFSETFTDGMVTNANREQDGQTYIQHDAPITNGNSGGPLLNSKGRVIGINTWIIVDGQNMNFAIPIDRVDEISQNSSKTLAEVCESEYGYSYDDNTWSNITSEGSQNVTVSSGSGSINFDIPDNFEVSDITNGKSYTYKTNDSFLNITAIIKDDISATGSDEDLEQLSEDFIDEICKQFKEDYDVDAEGTSTRGTINDNDWYLVSIQGQSEEIVIEMNVMFCYMNGSFKAIQFTTAGPTDSSITELREMAIQIMSTVKVN